MRYQAEIFDLVWRYVHSVAVFGVARGNKIAKSMLIYVLARCRKASAEYQIQAISLFLPPLKVRQMEADPFRL